VSTDGEGVGDGTGRSPGRPVGYLLAVEGPSVHVAELVVAPGFRRAGRATELLASLAASLDRGTRITVAVEPDNDDARSLYRSSGLRPVETLPDYFDRGPAVLLAGAAGDVARDRENDRAADSERAGDGENDVGGQR
jgi:ribosomal-protein-alanine N-acetyltransferase